VQPQCTYISYDSKSKAAADLFVVIKMSFLNTPDFTELAKTFEQASAHLKFLADSPDVHQGNLIVKALNDINSRPGNIEKSVKDLQDGMAHVRDRVDNRHFELLHAKAT
jgi:hypothetical protein